MDEEKTFAEEEGSEADRTAPETPAEEKEEKSISADLIRGHINTIILRALYDGDKYGYAIISEIERRSHGQYTMKEPSLYSALKRLEKNGYVTSYWGGSVAGGRRKYFSLTDEGKEISEQNQSEWEYSRTVIDSLISDKDFDFNNPAPTAVNMRMLRKSTSRVPSREGEDDELDYEPTFDDSAEQLRFAEEFEQRSTELSEEFERKNTALEEEYTQKSAALEEERKDFEEERELFARLRTSFEEEKNNFDEERRRFEEHNLSFDEDRKFLEEQRTALRDEKISFEEEKSQFEERLLSADEDRRALEEEMRKLEESKTSLEAEKISFGEEKQRFEEEKAASALVDKAGYEAEISALEENKKQFEEEMRARTAAYLTERDWREKELAEREKLIAEERKRLEALRAEQLSAAAVSREAENEELEAQAALLEEKKRLFEEEKEEKLRALEEELEARRTALEEEETSRLTALEAEESARRAALEEAEARLGEAREPSEEEIAEREALQEEIGRLREDLKASEEEVGRLREEQSNALDAQTEEEFKRREQEFITREQTYFEERNRFADERERLGDLIRQRDEYIESERKAHEAELEEQRKKIVAEMEMNFRLREQDWIHNNYLRLVSTRPPVEPVGEYTYFNNSAEQTPPPPSSADYREVVTDIFRNANSAPSEPVGGATAVAGIDLEDFREKGEREKIRVTTVGAKPAAKTESYSVVHKGKALFLSAIVVFFLCLIEGAVTFAVRKKYSLPIFYPYFMICAGLVLLLAAGLAYANRFGERSVRRNSPLALVNAIVIYALAVIITLIVALGVNIDFTSISAVATYIVVPVVFLFGIVVFGICYYLLVKPKKH